MNLDDLAIHPASLLGRPAMIADVRCTAVSVQFFIVYVYTGESHKVRFSSRRACCMELLADVALM